MAWPSTLSRAEFDQGCKALIAHPPLTTDGDVLGEGEIWRGWVWKEHPRYPGFGYLTREINTWLQTRPSPPDPPEVDLDHELVEAVSDAAESSQSSQQPGRSRLRVVEHVVFSATFRVPVFYFNAFDETGSPVPITDIIRSALFHLPLSPSALQVEPHGISLAPPTITDDTAELPLLTQGEHPTTGEACWYLHPCETSAAVKEILDAKNGGEEENMPRKWIDAWFLVLGRVVDLRASS